MSKAQAKLDGWVKDIAPSTELRKWFGHDPDRWMEFRRRYVAEIAGRREILTDFRDLARGSALTLIYGARDKDHNEAVVLKDVLLGRPHK